jgi:superfamily II DNA or RNA helicase
MTLQLRDYQQDLIDRLYRQWDNGKTKVMLQSPTGSGKSIVFSKLAIDAYAKRQKVLVIAHTEELVLQNAKHLNTHLPRQVGIIKAGIEPDYRAPIQSASVQTLINRMEDLYDSDLVIIDEAHHSSSNSYKRIIERYHPYGAKIVGLTATPIRTDGKGFEDIYEVLETGVSTAELIARDYLSKYVLKCDPRPMVKTTKLDKGDYDLKDLAELNSSTELAGSLVESYQKYAKDGSCITFAINIEHSQSIVKAYNDAGITAIHLDAKTEKSVRKSALRKLAAGEIKVISNVGLFGEGVDVPTLDCVQIARPTKSISLWLQMVGRVLRKAEGKIYGLILDHTDNYAMLGLPDDDWEWKLEGKPKKEKKQKDPQEIILKQIAAEEKRVISELKQLGLIQIASKSDGAKYWDDLLDRMKYQQQSKGYKKHWVIYRIQSKYPPLRIWESLAEYVGKQESWAIEHFKNQSRLAATEALRAVVKVKDPARAIAAVRTKWDKDLLQTAAKFLLTEQRETLKTIVETDNQRLASANI